MFGQRSPVAAEDAISLNQGLLKVCCRNGESVAFPLASGKTLPRVRSIFGRVGAPIHIDSSLGGLPVSMCAVSHQFLCVMIDFFPDAGGGRPKPRVIGGVRDALAF